MLFIVKQTIIRGVGRALAICLILMLAASPVIAGAQGEDLLSYEDAVARLGSVSLTDEDALDLINRSFDAVGARNFAPQYKYLTAALLELCSSENADFAAVDAALLLLGQNGAFVESYQENDGLAYFTLDALQGYVQARRLETQGDLAGAYQAYKDSQILDSLDRAMALTFQGSNVAAEPPQETTAVAPTETPELATVAPTETPVLETAAPTETPVLATATPTETPAQTIAALQTLAPEPTPGPVPWPTYTLKSYRLQIADATSNKQSYSGPSKNYSEAGSFVPVNMSRTDGLFKEDRYILVDMNYSTIGLRRVYFRCGIFRSTYDVPEATLTGYPALTTEPVTAWYGPGTKYNEFPEASLGANAPVTVFFEEDGYVFAEYQTAFKLVRAWIDAAYVVPE